MKRWITSTILLLAIAGMSFDAIAQAGTEVRVRESSNRGIADVQADHYNGPKARIAVARFENKTADSYNWYNPSIGDGMADMLTTALVNSGRFIVLERESLDTVIGEQDLGASGRVREDTAAAIGEIEGAELLIVAAVTEFDDDSGGRSGSLGGGDIGRVFGAITGGSRSAHMAIDLRVVDATTSRVLAATSVEGEAKDFDIGGALAGYTGSVGLGGALSAWENTPREEALRQVIGAAVDYVISVTPQEMMRYDASGRPVNASASAVSGSRAGSAEVGESGERLVITATSADAHQGPNTESPTAFTLTAGNMVEAVLRAGDWVQVRNDQGQTGWVLAGHTLEVQ